MGLPVTHARNVLLAVASYSEQSNDLIKRSCRQCGPSSEESIEQIYGLSCGPINAKLLDALEIDDTREFD